MILIPFIILAIVLLFILYEFANNCGHSDCAAIRKSGKCPFNYMKNCKECRYYDFYKEED